jgi:hypothetical protein
MIRSVAVEVCTIIFGRHPILNDPVWWSTDHTYKNAITNELFLYTSASGYLRGFGQKYLDNAKKTWTWRECMTQ